MNVNKEVSGILDQVMNMNGRSNGLKPESPLLGAIPELDSMAVVTILTCLEDHFGFTVEDDEISAETFATFGSLVEFVQQKLNR